MSVLETYTENKTVDWAKKHGFLAPKVKFVEDGYPDRLFLSPLGHTIFMEFKRLGEVPNALQLYRIGQLQQRKIPAFWSDNIIESISILATSVGAAYIPDERDTATLRAGVRGAISGSRAGKDVHRIGDVQDTEDKGAEQEDAHNRAAQALLQGLAGRDKEMGKLLQPALDYLARQRQGEKPTV